MWSQGLASQFCEGIAGKDEPTRSKKTKWTLDWNDLNLKWLEMTPNDSKWPHDFLDFWFFSHWRSTRRVAPRWRQSAKETCFTAGFPAANWLQQLWTLWTCVSFFHDAIYVCTDIDVSICDARRRASLHWSYFVAALPFLVPGSAYGVRSCWGHLLSPTICNILQECGPVAQSSYVKLFPSHLPIFRAVRLCAWILNGPYQKGSCSFSQVSKHTNWVDSWFFETISFRIRSGRAPEEEGTLYLPCGMCGARHFPKQWLFVSMCNFRLETKNEVCGICPFIWTSIASFGSSNADVSPANCLKFSLGKP